MGGDGKDTAPYAGAVDWNGSPENDNLHFDVRKLAQWEAVFAHAQRRGIHLHIVLNEAETPNKRELDDGTLGRERRLFYRELIARFGHHLALQWNISEEYDGGDGYDLGPERVKEFAAYIQRLDPYGHPVTVHNVGPLDTAWAPFLGDVRFAVTSFQLHQGPEAVGPTVEQWRRRTTEAGRPLVISVDEPPTVTRENAAAMRRDVLWPAYLSGGQLEWYVAAEDQSLEDFRAYEFLWAYTRYARTFLEEHLPFWEMEPLDRLLSGLPEDVPGQVFARPGEVYAVYLPRHQQGAALDLHGAAGTFVQRWYNPRSGRFEGGARSVTGDALVPLGEPPADPGEDWAILLRRQP